MTVAEANARWELLNQEISGLEKSALAHETAARADRLKREEYKTERDQLAGVIQSERAVSAIQQATADAATLKAQAEQNVAAALVDREEAAKLREEATKIIADLKAAQAPPAQ